MALLDQFDGDVPHQIPTDTEPVRCIHCDGENLDLSQLDRELHNIWDEVECRECGTTWTETYTIKTIQDICIPEDALQLLKDKT